MKSQSSSSRNKILSAVLAFTLVLSTVAPALADEPTHPSGGIVSITDFSGGNGGNTYGNAETIYFGTYWQNPNGDLPETPTKDNFTKTGIQWRVLTNDAAGTTNGKIMLLSDKGLYADQFKDSTAEGSNAWATSEVRETLNTTTAGSGFAGDAFESAEWNAIAETTTTISGATETTDKLFLLSYDEALKSNYGFSSSEEATATRQSYSTTFANNVKMYGDKYPIYSKDTYGHIYWWLRSPVAGYVDTSAYIANEQGQVTDSGANEIYVGVRPALNLDQASVLFLSAAEGGKNSVKIGEGFGIDNSYDGTNGWKLTLYDKYDATTNPKGIQDPYDVSFYKDDETVEETVDTLAKKAACTTAKTIDLTGGLSSYNVPYIKYSWTQAISETETSGDANYISAIVCDSEGNIVDYAKIGDASSGSASSGDQGVIIDTGNLDYDTSYTIKIFAEKANDDYATDYASELVTVTKTDGTTYTYTKTASGTPTYSGTLGTAYYNKGLTAKLGNNFVLTFADTDNIYDTSITLGGTTQTGTIKSDTNGTTTLSGTVTVADGQTLNVAGKMKLSGGVNSGAESPAGKLVIANGSELTLSGEKADNIGTLMNDGTVEISKDSNDTAVTFGKVNHESYANGALTITKGTVTVNDTLTQNSLSVGENGTLVIVAENLKTDVTNSGTVKLTKGQGATSLVKKITGGKIVIADDITSNVEYLASTGGITINEGMLLNLITGTDATALIDNITGKGTVGINGNITSDKTIESAVKIYNGRQLTNTGTINGAVSNEGTLVTTANGIAGGVTNNSSLTLTGENLAGNITGTNGETKITGAVTNNDGKIITQKTLEIASGASLQTIADNLVISSGTITNKGTLMIAGGTIKSKITGTTGILEILSLGNASPVVYDNAAQIDNKLQLESGAKFVIAADLLPSSTIDTTNNGNLYLKTGTLGTNIAGNGTTNLQDPSATTTAQILTVQTDREISGTFNGCGGTIDMHGGEETDKTKTLTIGTLAGTTNLKIDVDMSDFTSDQLSVTSDVGATVNLIDIVVTKDITPSALGNDTITYVTGASNGTYYVDGETTGTINYTTNNYKYTFTAVEGEENKGKLAYTAEAKNLSFKEFMESSDPTTASLGLTADLKNKGEDIATITQAADKTINLNGYDLTSESDSNIKVNGNDLDHKISLIVNGGEEENAGTVDDKTTFEIGQYGTLTLSGNAKLEGAITDNGEVTVAEDSQVSLASVTGSGKLTNSGTLTAGSISVANVTINNGSILTVGANNLSTETLTNNGTLCLTGGGAVTGAITGNGMTSISGDVSFEKIKQNMLVFSNNAKLTLTDAVEVNKFTGTGSVNIAEGTTVTKNVTVTSMGGTDSSITLTNDGTLNANLTAENSATLNFTNKGTWTPVFDTANETSTTNANVTLGDGSYVNVADPNWKAGDTFRTLSFTGSAFSSQGGIFVINTDIANTDESKRGDVIDLTGTAVANGTAKVQVAYDKNFATGAAITGSHAFLKLPSSSTEETLAITALATKYKNYTYTPELAYDDDADAWMITALTMKSEGPSVAAKAASSSATSIGMAWIASINNLQKRLGDLRGGEASNMAWARFQHSNDDLNLATKQNIAGNLYQVGYDYLVASDKFSKTFLGVSLDIFDGTQSYENGGGDIKSATLSTYFTKIYENGHYFDFIARYGKFDSDTTSYDPDEGKSTKLDLGMKGFTFSGEYGYRLKVGRTGLYLEPQVEVIYGYMSGDKTTSSDGTVADVDSSNHLITRAGIALGQKVKDFNYYLRASYYHNFLGTSSVIYGDEYCKEDGAKNWWEVSLGGGWNLGRASYFYFELVKHFKDLSNSVNFNLGFRFTL